MKVSVVIPYQNRSIFNCVSSVLKQTYANIEVVLIDYSEPWNIAKARNKGIMESHGELTVILDADIILEPMVIANLMELHSRIPDAYITAQVRMLKEKIEYPRDVNDLDKMWKGLSLGYGGLFSARRKWWIRVRGFDERRDTMLLEDIDMRERAKMDGMQVGFLNSLLEDNTGSYVYHEPHPNRFMGLSESEKNRVLERRRELEKDREVVTRFSMLSSIH